MEPQQESQMLSLRKSQEDLVAKSNAIVISDKKTFDEASDFTKSIKILRKQFTDLKDFLVKPIKEHVKTIEAQFKPNIDKLDMIEGDVKTKMSTWWQQEEAKRLKEEERLRKEQEKKFAKEVAKAEKQGKEAPPPPPLITIEKPKTDGISFRKIWTFSIENETLVPREYLTIDKVKIGKVVKAGIRSIPGVKIYEETSAAVSTKENTEGL